MDGWDTEDLDDYPGEFDDSEYSGEAARRALRRRGGGRAPGRPLPPTQSRTAMERTRRLEAMQKRNAVQQSSDTFGPMATSAAGAFALAKEKKEYLEATLTHALPIAQILTSSRGRAIGAAFRANPVVSLGFPIAALAIGLLKDKIPGLAPEKLDRPLATFDSLTLGGTNIPVLKITNTPSGAIVKYSRNPGKGGAAASDPGEPTQPCPAILPVAAGDWLRFVFVKGDSKSEPADYPVPPVP